MICGNRTSGELGTNIYKLESVHVKKPPKIGGHWKGVSHYKLVMEILEQFGDMGLDTVNPLYFLHRKGTDIVFSINVIMPELPNTNHRVKGEMVSLLPAFGFAASNIRRRTLTFYCGASSIAGASHVVAFQWPGKRYTLNFSAEDVIDKAIRKWLRHTAQLNTMMRQMKGVRLTDNRIVKIMMEAGYRSLLPWSRVGKIADKMKITRATLWGLVIEFGNMVAKNPPHTQMDQQTGFMELLLDLYPEVFEDPLEVDSSSAG